MREADFTTLSGMTVEPAYGHRGLGVAGRVPVHPRSLPDRLPRQDLDDPPVRRLRQRRADQRAIPDDPGRGGGGLSVAFDMPTLMGRDSDDRALGEVGHCGVAIDSAADMEPLFDGIALGDVTTSMTISGPAVPVFCMYSSPPSARASTPASSTAPCRPTSSRSTSPRRSGSSRPSRTCG